MDVNLTGLLTIVGVLSVVAERTVELLKGVIPYDKIKDDKLKTLAIQGTACIVAAVTAITSTAAINPQLPVYLRRVIAKLNSIFGEATALTDKVALVNHVADIVREDANTVAQVKNNTRDVAMAGNISGNFSRARKCASFASAFLPLSGIDPN